LGIPNWTIDASLYSVKPIWMQEVKSYLETCQMLKTLNLAQKQRLVRKAKTFYFEKRNNV
jgi:hypothetical protein